MSDHITYAEYINLLDYMCTFEIRREETRHRMLYDMGLRRDGIGSIKYLIIDKQKWMLAKLKHGF